MGRKTAKATSSGNMKNKKSSQIIETPEIPSESPEILDSATPVLDKNQTTDENLETPEITPDSQSNLLPKQSSALNILSEQIICNYEGDLNDDSKGQFTGHGKAEFVTKNTYEGEFQEGCMHGSGTYKFEKDDIIYTGDFFLNKLTGTGMIEYKKTKAEYQTWDTL